MSKGRLWLNVGAYSTLIAPNLIYLGCNVTVLKEANAIALTMTAMLVLSIIGIGALTHIKMNNGIWIALIGVFILALSNIAYVAGVALLIEGGAICVDGYVFKPLIIKQKMRELKKNGEQVIYTTEVK